MPSIDPRATSTNPSALFTPSSQVLALYSSAKGGTSSCPVTKLDTYGAGYHDNGSSNVKTHYCATGSGAGMVGYWMSNMDTDCDGGPATGACANDPSHQDQTDATTVSGGPVNTSEVPYVVIDQEEYFDPSKAPLKIAVGSPVLVICGEGGMATWGVWGDTNALQEMGEASITLAQTCFGTSMTGNSGHDAADVLYMVFANSQGYPIPNKWTPGDDTKLAAMGNGLLAKSSLAGGSSGGGSSAPPSASSSASSGPNSSKSTKSPSSPVAALTTPSSSGPSATDSPSAPSSDGVNDSESISPTLVSALAPNDQSITPAATPAVLPTPTTIVSIISPNDSSVNGSNIGDSLGLSSLHLPPNNIIISLVILILVIVGIAVGLYAMEREGSGSRKDRGRYESTRSDDDSDSESTASEGTNRRLRKQNGQR